MMSTSLYGIGERFLIHLSLFVDPVSSRTDPVFRKPQPPDESGGINKILMFYVFFDV